jgi:predicted O-linked N-acetylglucosamine transferase (SPINDLY family)
MDYQRFIETLPNLYYYWGQKSVRPKSNQFQQVLEHVRGTTTANVMQLLNCAVECIEPDEIYCEVGPFQAATLIGALFEHPDQMACAVEKFCESDNANEKFEKLVENISAFKLEDKVVICDQDFEEFLFENREFKNDNKIGVYFYNGAKDYRAQIVGLLLVKNLLADKALIIIGNSNGSAVQQAIWDFIAAHPQCQMLLDLPTPEDGHSTFWNGIQVLSWDITRNYNYNFSDIKQRRNETLIQAIYNLQFEFDNHKKTLDNLHREALTLDHYGCYEEAEKKYKEILQWDENRADVLLNLGTLYYTTNRYQQALDTLLKCLELEPSKPIHHYSIGLVLEKVGAVIQSVQAYEEAITLDPEWIDAYNNLGNIFLKAGKIEQAEANYRKAIAANPNHFGSHLNLGNVLMERHQIDEAVETYEKALQLKPRDPDILHNLGVALDAKNDPAQAALYYGYAYYRKGQYQEAINQYQHFLETQTGDVHFYITLADCYKNLNQYEETIKNYQEAIQLYPKAAELYFFLALALRDFGRTQEAIAFVTEASQLLPDNLILKLEKQFLLPIIYENEEEIDLYRIQFLQGLEELIQQISLDTPEGKSSALMAVGSGTNFFLQYQGKNDLEPQKQYGQFVNQVIAANYPQWSNSLPMPPLHEGEKIRVGYVSAYLRNHNGARWALGWIQNHNKQKFEIYCYHTGRKVDQVTQQFKLSSDVFHHIPEDLESVCNQIVSDKLHILIFPDIGMEPSTTQMAGLRLAPVQCTAWGHPITSGLPTIDYYLSSDLMEPENAQEHYSEQLVRLPNIGLCYPKPIVPQPTKTRSEFQLRDDAVVYLSCQSLFKYLPQYDYIFPAILKQVPQAQIAFLSHQSAYITEKFRQRLKRAFANFGLNSEDYCVIVPRQSTLGYLSLNLVSDVYLDTLSWSGGNSTLEAIACNLPIVTCPGEFMRGRHSYAILKMLGVTDTIAENEAEYIKIALRLGLESEWRNSIVERMIHRHSYLYDDETCVEVLDAFFRRVAYED